jgi:hypothetical protein
MLINTALGLNSADDVIALVQDRVQRAGREELVDVGLGGAASDADDSHAERPGQLGDHAPDLAEADDGERFLLEGVDCAALPVVRPLFGSHPWPALCEVQHGEYGILGQRARVHACGVRDDDRCVNKLEAADPLADTGARRLDPA